MKVKAEHSLLAIIIFAAAVIIFPFLGEKPLRSDEISLLELARTFMTSGISNVFDGNGIDFPRNFYAYLVSIALNNLDLSDAICVRLPSAVTMALLSIGMYQFRGSNEKMSKAFLASLLFLSCYAVTSLAYHANPVTITALSFIFSLSAIYHWIKSPTSTKVYLAIATTACAAIFMGLFAPIIVLVSGIAFMLTRGQREVAAFFKFMLIPCAAIILAYGTLIFVTNDQPSAHNVLGFEQITASFADFNTLGNLFGQIFLSIFPWSIPIGVAIFWIAYNPSWIKDKFSTLSLFKQFGVVIFIIAMPSLLAFNRLSVIMLLMAVYFNMPIISSFLLSQIHNHTVTWRITGFVFSAVIVVIVCIYAATLTGVTTNYLSFEFARRQEWSVGNVAIIVAIIVCLYHQWRNQRLIKFNNRYLYNIVVLYLLAQMLYVGFINPYMEI